MSQHSVFSRPSGVALLACLCCLLWGSAFPSIKLGYAQFHIATGDVPSKLVFAGWRFVMAGALLLLWARATGRAVWQLSAAQWRQVVALGLLQTSLQYVFFYIGLAYTTGAKGSIMNATSVFFGVIMGHFLYTNDRLTWAKALGCVIGFAGVLVVNFHADLLDFQFDWRGEGFVVVAALVLTLGVVFGKRVSQGMDAAVMTAHQLTVGGLALLLVGYALGGHLVGSAPGQEGAGAVTALGAALLLYMALLSAVAFAVWSLLLKHNPVGVISVFNFLIPVFGVLLSALLLGESVWEWKYAAALLLVCSGIALVTRPRKA